MSVTLEAEITTPRPPVRLRVKPGLHILAQTAQVRLEYGRQDRVEFSFEGHIDFQDPEDLGTLLYQHLTETSVGRIFGAPYRPGSIIHLRIRNGWLFGGKMTILPASNQSRRRVQVHLTVNPTRFAAYAARFNVNSVSELAQVPAYELLRDDPVQKAILRQQTLDGEQNFIPQSAWMSAVTRNWNDLVQLYLTATREVIEREFAERAAAMPNDGLSLTLNDPCGVPKNMKRVETYWEFGAADALLAFAGLERWLIAAAPNVTQTERTDYLMGRDRAARWIKFTARQGVQIAAYAKAQSRLRLEVRHFGFDRPSIGQRLSPALQFSGTTTLLERLERLRVDAARRINLLLSHAELAPLVRSAASADAFALVLSEVSRACRKDPRLLPVVFAQLVASSAVSAVRPSSLFNACEALCRSGILQRSTVVARSRSARFLLTEPYRTAVDGFRSFLAAQAEAAEEPHEGEPETAS